MAKFIEARVIQKVATEAEWLNVALPLYNGEIALVRSGDRVVNMKIGNGTAKFSELNYVYNGGFNGSINPSTNTIGLQNGFYFAEISGTYSNAGNIVVKEGYYTILEKYSGGWKKSTEVKMPMQDLTPLENRTTALENRIEPNGNVTVGQTNRAVNGDKVERYVQRNAFVDFKHSFADKDGYEINSKVFVDNKFWISKVDGNKDYPSKTSTKWEEFKISEDLENRVNTLDGKVQAVEDSVNTLEGKVQVVEDDINTLESELNITKDKVTDLENKNGGDVEFGNIKNVEGRKVFDYVNNKSITKFNPTAYVSGYPKDALVFHNDEIWMSMVNLNTETPQKGTSKWKEVKMSADVDQEFDENSENALSNKKVTKLKTILNSFVKENISLGLITIPSFTSGIVNKSGVIEPNENHQYIKIDNLRDVDYIHYKGFRLAFLADSDVLNYKHILGKRTDGSYISMSEALKSIQSNQQGYDVVLNTKDITEIYINKLNSVVHNITIEKFKGTYNLDSVKNYIDDISNLDYQVQDKLNYKPAEMEQAPINFETIGVDLNSNANAITGKVYCNNLLTKGYGKITEIRFKSDIAKDSQKFLIYKKLPNNKVRLLNFAYCPNVVVGENIFNPINFICEKDCVIGVYVNRNTFTNGGNYQYFEVSKLNLELNSEVASENPQSGYFPIIFDIDYTYKESQEEVTFKSQVINPLSDLQKNKGSNYISLNNSIKMGCISFIDDDQPAPVYEWLIPLFLKYETPIGIAFISNVNKGQHRDSIAKMYNKKHSNLVEFFNHTKTHRSSHNSDSYEIQFEEINYCHNYMINTLGIEPKGYISPFGRFNQTTLDIIEKLKYNQHYRFDYEIESNSINNFFNLGIKRVNFGFNSGGFPFIDKNVLINEIDKAVDNNEWLVITSHYRTGNEVISTFKQDIEEILQYIKMKKIRVMLPSKAFELYCNIIEVDNGFRISKNGEIKTEHIPYSYR